MPVKCVVCNSTVRNRQHALACDDCGRWQHRLCDTGISVTEYRAISRGDHDLHFQCNDCHSSASRDQLLPDRSHSLDDVIDVSLGPIQQLSLPVLVSAMSPIPPTSICSVPSPSPPSSPTAAPMDATFTISRDDEQPDQSVDQPSFNISLDINPQDPITESDIEDADHEDTFLDDQPVTFEIVDGGTKQRARKLVSSDGYAYTVKKSTESSTYWRCSVRSKTLWCKATVTQRGNTFFPGSNSHQHPSDPGLAKKTKIHADVLATANTDHYRSAGDIVDQKMDQHISQTDFNLPKPANLIRAANRLRQRMRPSEPKDLTFDIDHTFLDDEDFFRGDIRVDSSRHIIFASRTQLDLLEKAKTWYVDGTFKVINHPFVQLFTVHAFLQKEDSMKQVPLLFTLMSRRQKKDYDAVFEHIKDLIPNSNVKAFTLDFEAAAWKSIADNYPEAEIKGCSFHWGQAVMRKVANLGLKTTYDQRKTTHQLIRKILSLPYLPADHIQPTFTSLATSANTPELQELMRYINATWMNSSVWSVSQWSVFRQPVRTNNDTEGWHRRFIGKAGGNNLHFYRLVPALRREAESVTLCMRLVDEQQITRYQRETYRRAQGRLVGPVRIQKNKDFIFSSCCGEAFLTCLWSIAVRTSYNM